MKNANRDLDRLLRSAAQAPGRSLAELDLGLQHRVLAEWRRGAGAAAALVSPLLGWWWRGALAACSLAALLVVAAVLNVPADVQDPYATADETLSLLAPSLAAN